MTCINAGAPVGGTFSSTTFPIYDIYRKFDMQAADQKARLIAKKAELEERIDRLSRDQRHADEPVEKDFEEQATQRENDDVVTNLLRESRIELQQIQRALTRMDAGDYGACSNCGADIGEGRLNAVPEATLCIKCAK